MNDTVKWMPFRSGAALILMILTAMVAPAQESSTSTRHLVVNASDIKYSTDSLQIFSSPTQPDQPDQLSLNFRGVPLDTVLEYLSRAAGFVIVRTVDVSGSVDVVSHQPMTRDEAVALLNTVLNEQGYAAIRNDRTLTIVTREQARQRDIPVRLGNDPDSIPRSDEMITQIIPVRYANARALIEDLKALVPEYASISANDSSNAIVLTDTQTGVRRMTEIIRGLDQSITAISAVRVFNLKYADAKETADLIKTIFEIPQASGRDGGDRSSSVQQFFQRMRGDGEGGRSNERSSSGGSSAALQAASRVTAAADERTNALVISAPQDLMPAIEEVIADIDQSAQALTVVRVFTLHHSDATEMAEIITNIFGEEGQAGQTQSNRGGFRGPGEFFARMAGGMPPGGGGSGGRSSQQSDLSARAVAENTVLAVADTRTNSVIVSAASEVMDQVEQVIADLDRNPAKTKKVQVYSVKNANPEELATTLQEMFGSDAVTGSTANRSTNTNSTRSSSSSNTRSNRNSGSSSESDYGSSSRTNSSR